MDRIMGISGVADPDLVPFVPVGDTFLRKHGRSRCPCCRGQGVERIVEIAPAVRGAARKEAAVCREHEQEGRELFRRSWREARPDHSEAAFSLGI